MLNQVLESDLPDKLKKYLIFRLEDIIGELNKYCIDTSAKLETATMSVVGDLVI